MDIQKEHSSVMSAVRGRGTFIAFNCASPEMRDALTRKLLTKGKMVKKQKCYKQICYIFHMFLLGIQAGGCGNQSVRLRPALTFTERHADIFLNALRSVLKE